MKNKSAKMKNGTEDRTSLLLLSSFFIVLLILNFFTFCWSDEALYLSTVHSFFMNERPLVDEWIAQQFYASIILPFYSLYIRIVGSNEGIYLVARIASIIIHSSISFLLYFYLKKQWSNTFLACISSALYMLFCKSNILGVSYYSFSLDFYMAGILFIMCAQNTPPHHISNFLAGILFGISILSNPFIVVIYIGYSIFYLLKGRKQKKENLKDFIINLATVWAGTIFVAIVFLVFILSRTSPSQITENLSYIFSDPTYGGVNYAYRTMQYFRYLITSYPFTFPFMFGSAIYLFVKKLKNQEVSLMAKKFLFVLNLICFFANLFICNIPGTCVIPAFFLAVVCRLILNEKLFSGDEIKFFILPGFFLSIIYQWASDTNISAMAIGFAITIPGTLFIIFDFIDKFFDNKKSEKMIKILIGISLIIILGIQRFTQPYRDAAIPYCTERLEQGPAKGLYTTNERKQMYNEICKVMNSIKAENPDDTIFISPMMPWAYLMYNGKYGSFQTWRTSLSDNRLRIYYETTKHNFPKYVIQLDEKYALSSQSKEAVNSFHGWFYDEILMKQYDSKRIEIGTLFTKK